MVESRPYESVPMYECTKDISEKIREDQFKIQKNFPQRNDSIKRTLAFQRKVEGGDIKFNKSDGVALIIPTADALENWKEQSKEIANIIKREKEDREIAAQKKRE